MTYALPTTGLATDDAPTGPASTIGEVWDASVKAQRDVSNPLSRAYVLGEEYDKRIREVEGATGIRLHHPLRDAPADADYIEAREDPEGGWQGSLGQGAVRKKSELRFHRELSRLAELHPDKAEALRPGATVWDDAYARVRKAEQASGDVTARSPLAVNVPILGPVDPVGLAGSMFGFFHDPVNVATMLIGPNGSAAKGILWNASRQAVAGAAQQAAIEPFTQAWRAEAGLDFGWRQAAGNILMAGVAGGALDAAGRSAWRGLAGLPQGGTPETPRAVPGAPANENVPSIGTRESVSEAPVSGRLEGESGSIPRKSESLSDPMDALEAAARRLPEDHPARRAADGDPEATIALAERAMAHSDDPEAMRGALDQFRMETRQNEAVAAAWAAAGDDLAAAARIRAQIDEEIGRAAQHVADPDSVPPTRPVIVAPRIEDLSLMFAGRKARTADLDMLARAEEMEANGAAREAIWRDTGWFKGVDGQWRFEIDDSKASLSDALSLDRDVPLPEHLKHGRLWRAYPDGRRIGVGLEGDQANFGSFDAIAGRVGLAADIDPAFEMGTLLHEAQHFVQTEEGFASGGLVEGASKRARDAYRRLAGEVEARTVEKRMDMTPAQRRARAPWLDYDVPEAQQIVRLRDGELNPVAAAALIRERPELAGEVPPTTETARGIHALAALSDAGFARVTAGEVEPQLAALVASSAPPGAHADLIDRLVAARPRDLDHARRLVAEMLQAPTDVATASRILGLEDSPAPDAGRINAPVAGGQPKAQRTIAREFDEPVGEAAKAQADALAPAAERAARIEDLSLSLREARARVADAAPVGVQAELGSAKTAQPKAPRKSLAGTAYAPRFLDAEAQLAADLADAATRTLPRNVALQVSDRLRAGGYELDGYFDRRNNILAVALDAGDPRATFTHERIHALKEHGLFTPEEWGLMVAEARKAGVRQEMGRDLVEAYREQLTPGMVKERLAARGVTLASEFNWDDLAAELQKAKLLDPKDVRGSLERAGLWDEARLQAMIDEETVARLAETWRAGGDVPAGVKGLLERVMAFLERVRNVLAGHGFQTLDDVFRRIDDGEVAMRTPREVALPGGMKVSGIHLRAGGSPDIAEMLLAIRAYHGSPHDFDRFSLDKIGTGEGAQTYGHGLYFAESEVVAKSYKGGLSQRTTLPTVDDAQKAIANAVGTAGRTFVEDFGTTPSGRMWQVFEEVSPGGLFKKSKKRAIGTIREIRGSDGSIQYYPHTNEPGALVNLPNSGLLYEVSIKADPDDFLDWDKPLSQQNERVKSAFRKAHPRGESLLDDVDPYYVRDALEKLGSWRMKPGGAASGMMSSASDALLEAGIPGIKYFDQGSRVAGDGSRNYVVFDDSLIEIVAKDGQRVGQPRLQSALDDAAADADAGALVQACKLF